MSHPGGIKWVVFDWGNVICDYRPLGFPKLAAHLGVALDPLVDAMASDAWLSRLCDGTATPQAFVRWLGERFGTQVDVATVCELFASDVAQRLPGIDEVVNALQGRYRLAILSNTFFGHWGSIYEDPFYAAFEMPLASHLLGAAKPEPRIFMRALAELAAAPHEVVFLDDAERNVEAARAHGMGAIHATSVDATRNGLRRLGLL